MCHCLACQRRTGSVFAAQARWPRERVTLKGPSTEIVRISDEGNAARFHFCPACGATVWYALDTMPDTISIPIGAFAEIPRTGLLHVRGAPTRLGQRGAKRN